MIFEQWRAPINRGLCTSFLFCKYLCYIIYASLVYFLLCYFFYISLFYLILSDFVSFYSIVSYFILFHSIYFILFIFSLFYFMLFYFIKKTKTVFLFFLNFSIQINSYRCWSTFKEEYGRTFNHSLWYFRTCITTRTTIFIYGDI